MHLNNDQYSTEESSSGNDDGSTVFHACYKDDQEGWMVIGDNSTVSNLPIHFHLKPEKVLMQLAHQYGNLVTNTRCDYNSFQQHIHFEFLSYDDDTNTAIFQGTLKDDSKFFPWKKEFRVKI